MEKLNWKRIALLCLPIVFAVSLAITLAACMAQAGKNPDDSAMEDDGAGALPAASANLSTSSAGLEYRSLGDGSCELTGIGSCTDTEITVPSESPAGDRVTSVASSAFIGCTNVITVRLPAGIAAIGDYAFYGSSINNVTVPSTTASIGECAFANCISLTAITVDNGNESYCSIDGVLFSKDKSVLITYPSGKSGDTYTIRRGVGTICNAAFLNCGSLSKISFNGSQEEWKTVKVGANNVTLQAVSVTFIGAAIK